MMFLAAIAAVVAAAPAPAQMPAVTVWMNPPLSQPLTVVNGQLSANGQRVVVPGVNVSQWALFGIVDGKQNVPTGLDAAACALVKQHVHNIAQMGFKVIRLGPMDQGTWNNVFCVCNGFPAGVAPRTTQLDSYALQAIAFWMDCCKQEGLRVIITLHCGQVLQAADVLVATNNAANPPPEFAECLATNYGGTNVAGEMWPWECFSPGMQALRLAYEQQLLKYVSPYDNVPLGQNQALFGLVIENEHSLGRELPYGWGNTKPTCPVLSQMYATAAAAYCQANGIVPAKMTGTQHAQMCASWDVALFQASIANIRPLAPHAQLIAGTYFGDSKYPSLAGVQCGDVSDCHFYSRYAPSDLNGFANGRTVQDLRSRFAAVLGGCAAAGKPLFVTEWGPQGQFNKGQLDPAGELAVDLQNAYTCLIQQDVDLACLFAYANVALTADNPAATVGCYDLRCCQPFLAAVQSQNARFCDLTQRPTSTITVQPTGGFWAGGYGPLTDPALYAVTGTQRVIVSQAAPQATSLHRPSGSSSLHSVVDRRSGSGGAAPPIKRAYGALIRQVAGLLLAF